MVLLRRKRVTAAKIESTSGTAETLAASDAAFNIYNAVINETVAMANRESQGSFDMLSSVAGQRSGVATFQTDIAWDGTTTLPTWATVLLPCCGYVNSSGVFTPRSEAPGSNVKTATIGVYTDGKRKQISGASGSFRMVFPAGQRAFIEWTFTGAYDGPTVYSYIMWGNPFPGYGEHSRDIFSVGKSNPHGWTQIETQVRQRGSGAEWKEAIQSELKIQAHANAGRYIQFVRAEYTMAEV